ANPARDELLALVPPDVGFCVAVTDLRGHAEKLRRSPLVQKIRESPLVRALRTSPEALQLAQVEAELQQRLGVSVTQLRDEVLGDAVVFAYRPGPPGQPDQEQGVVLLRARDPALLDRLIERVNQEQKRTEELHGLEKREHRGVTYYRRAEAKKD